MARIRTIKPEFWDSPGTARASLRARLFFIAMWNWADDYGVGTANPKQLVGFAFPNDDDVTVADFPRLRTEVSECYDVVWYEVDSRPYYCIPSWDDHQKNERRAKGKYPTPDQGIRTVTETHGSSAPKNGRSGTGTGEQGNRGTGNTSPVVTELDFNEAWQFWPKKVERKKSFEQFKRVAKVRGPAAVMADIERFGRAYEATTPKQFVPALNVWLGHERWTDELPSVPVDGRLVQAPTPVAPRLGAACAHRFVGGWCAECSEREVA